MSCTNNCKVRGKKPGRAPTTEKNKYISFVSLDGGTSDGMGGTLPGEAVFYSTMASIWPHSSKETIENMRNELEVTHKIRIWYHAGITAKMVIRFGSRNFDIVGIINKDEANVTLDFIASERL